MSVSFFSALKSCWDLVLSQFSAEPEVTGTVVVTTTVPVTSGSAENWDKTKSTQLFDALKNDTEIPQSAIYN